MKKLLLSAAAFGLLSGAALAEPQKLDDSILGEVAAGQPMNGSGFQVSTSEMNSMFTTTNETSSTVREANQTLTAMSGNTVYATGLASTGVTATGAATTSIMAPISFP